MKNISLVFAIILFSTLTSCQKTQKDLTILQVNGKSTLKINNRSTQKAKISVNNWTNLTLVEENTDTLVAPDQTVQLTVTTEARDYYFVYVNGTKYRLYAAPGKTIELSITPGKEEITFEGDFKEINKFLTTRHLRSDWNPWNNGLHEGASIQEIMAANDSVYLSQKKQLTDYEGLPSWYRDFESLRLEYINADASLSALNYRKKMMSGSDTIPKNFLEEITKDIQIESEDFAGVTAYMRFLDSYLGYKRDPLLEGKTPGDKEEWVAMFEDIISAANQHISNQNIREAILTNNFSLIIGALDHIWDDRWLDNINNPELSDLVEELSLTIPVLAEGDQLPYFKLRDMDSQLFESTDFEGKVTLINFWNTGCKPCIKDFPHENQLVEQFKDQPVAIVNICLDSTEDQWRKLVEKHKLKTKNLFAEQSSSEQLHKDFGIWGFPHNILIDSKGKVIKNQCARASAGIDELINDALVAMTE